MIFGLFGPFKAVMRCAQLEMAFDYAKRDTGKKAVGYRCADGVAIEREHVSLLVHGVGRKQRGLYAAAKPLGHIAVYPADLFDRL
jgi:hypothetical protein